MIKSVIRNAANSNEIGGELSSAGSRLAASSYLSKIFGSEARFLKDFLFVEAIDFYSFERNRRKHKIG